MLCLVSSCASCIHAYQNHLLDKPEVVLGSVSGRSVHYRGAVQLVRVAAQTRAVRLAEAADASGLLPSLLGDSGLPYLSQYPMLSAEQCQARAPPVPPPPSAETIVSFHGAVVCGCAGLSLGLVLTPALRFALAKAGYSDGVPARVLRSPSPTTETRDGGAGNVPEARVWCLEDVFIP